MHSEHPLQHRRLHFQDRLLIQRLRRLIIGAHDGSLHPSFMSTQQHRQEHCHSQRIRINKRKRFHGTLGAISRLIDHRFDACINGWVNTNAFSVLVHRMPRD
jgi:hypothetical protein